MSHGTQYSYQLSGLGGSVGHMQGATLAGLPYTYESPGTIKAKMNKDHWTNEYSMRAAGGITAGTLLLAYVGWYAWKKLKKR